MVSDLSVGIFFCALLAIFIFFIWSRRTQKKRQLLHRLFLMLALAYSSWVIPLIVMRFVDVQNTDIMFFLDCIMQPGGALCAPIYLCIAITFVEGYERMRKWMKILFIFPMLTILIAWTNPIHHLYYVTFSVVRSEIEFGPYILISGLCNYVYLISAVALRQSPKRFSMADL